MLRAFTTIRRDTLGFLVGARQRWGDAVTFPIPTVPVLFVSDVDAVSRVLQENARAYTKQTIQYTSLAAVTGEGLLTSDGEVWRRNRRLVQPAFHRRTLDAVAACTAAAAEATARDWGSALQRGDAVVDVDAAMMHAALDVVGQTLLGVDLREDAERVVSAVLSALDVVVARARLPLPVPPWVPTPGNRRMGSALATIDATVGQILAARTTGGAVAPDDLLGLLLAARDGDVGLSAREVRDEVVTMIVAGHETVASALSWTWSLLARHPEVQDAVATEARDVLGGRAPTFDDLPRLAMSRRVVDEALRLYPPAWVISRRASEDDELAGVPIPAGTLVIISPYVVHRHPDVWSRPEVFDPSRFEGARPGQPRDVPRAAYLPFGAGPRLCVGREFALVEATLLLASLAQRFAVRPAGPPPAVDALVTMRPHAGLPLRLEERDG